MSTGNNYRAGYYNQYINPVIIDIIYCLSILLLTLYLRSQAPLMIGFVITFFYLKLTGRDFLVIHLLIAFIVAFIWVSFAKDNYHYGKDFIEICGICPYPVFVWGMGLFSISLLLSNFKTSIKTSLIIRLVLYTSLCTVCLIITEYSAYHFFNFRNQATSNYSAIPLINCIHGPGWMQVMYFLLGPIYSILLHIVQYLPDVNSKWIKYFFLKHLRMLSCLRQSVFQNLSFFTI